MNEAPTAEEVTEYSHDLAKVIWAECVDNFHDVRRVTRVKRFTPKAPAVPLVQPDSLLAKLLKRLPE